MGHISMITALVFPLCWCLFNVLKGSCFPLGTGFVRAHGKLCPLFYYSQPVNFLGIINYTNVSDKE